MEKTRKTQHSLRPQAIWKDTERYRKGIGSLRKIQTGLALLMTDDGISGIHKELLGKES